MADREPEREPRRPWRTEGLPAGHPADPATDGNDKQPRRSAWRGLVPLLAVYAVIFFLLTAQDRSDEPPTVPYTVFQTQVTQRNVTEVFSKGDSIQGTLKKAVPLPDGKKGETYKKFSTERPSFAEDNLLSELEAGGATVRATPVVEERGNLANLLISFGPIILLIAFYWWMSRRAGGLFGGGGAGGLLGRSSKRVAPDTVRTTFADVAGIDEVKAEISEIVDFLRDPGKYTKLGARAPKGVLLAGPPGTGKTLLARATAGEAQVPFFSASASEFIEAIVGVGASRVRQLFAEARKVAPAIVFIDEIDTIGRSRSSAAYGGGNDEREQTLNQILTEMDGFSGTEGVITLAATNRADVLDSALLRPGRFDRTITVQPPDRVGRAAILRVHARDVPLGADVDLDGLARATPGMTGADLANLINQGALTAAHRGESTVSEADLADALEKIQLGTARTVVMPAEERRRTAFHESGHALLGMLQPGSDPVRRVSIIPRGQALGVTLSTPDTDKYGYDQNYLRGRIVGALGGMAAESVVFGVVTTGAESDLQAATGIARNMVARWGMSERIGPVSVLPPDSQGIDVRAVGVSEELLGRVDEEVRRIIEECYATAVRTLREHTPQLSAIAEKLLAEETLDGAQVYAAAGLDRPAVTEAV